jgi:hypothetical protein
MKHPREEELALYSTSDLEPAALSRIAVHVNGCPRCRECLAQFEQVERVLAGMAAAPEAWEPESGDLQEVRQRVMLALPVAHKPRWRIEWALAAATLLALLVLLSRNSHSPVEPHTNLANSPLLQMPGQLPSSPVAVTDLAAPRPRRRLLAPGLRSIALVTRPDRQSLIRIVTTDPNVVILLPANPQNDERTESNE